MPDTDIEEGPSCPLPFSDYERVVLAHGGGGRVMQRLIRDLFVAAFGGAALERGHDGAVLRPRGPIAVTTDAFTVSPRTFPGGDLGSLAVHGTVNDLAMCGARPLALTASFILEEGLELRELATLVEHMAAAARSCGVEVVTGDTKVVERGKGDGVFITTTGVGELLVDPPPGPERLAPGDAIVVSGPIGEHGVAVLAAREGLSLEPPLVSDAGPVHAAALALVEACEVHCLRDPTRGGLASVLAELATASGSSMHIREADVPVRPAVADTCELLGLDPLYVACEGRFVAFVPAAQVDDALACLRRSGCEQAAHIGALGPASADPLVFAESALGGRRILDLLSSEQLPRIC
ncbi:hydrogenase expression/formation protein HypE [Plesiocystis pacifica]|uniref:hydrogenase expression/formation protein HypE n=1 Tax=Plesiocystis pacifica TaxID=191768 RepID=UPI0005D47014|nr:hydrogenase expression/formation protein HypE [Plesiocystis pacifica]